MYALAPFTIAIFALASLAAASPTPIPDFDSLLKALNQGEQVRVVYNYAKCQYAKPEEPGDTPPDAIGGKAIDTYEYFGPGFFGDATETKGQIQFSESKLIFFLGRRHVFSAHRLFY